MYEALRGPRSVLELHATERARANRGCATSRPRPGAAEREPRSSRAPAITRASSHSARPYRYADAYELAGRPQPSLVCLDGVTDPQNLGAVCRSAPMARERPASCCPHRSARVTPSVCRASAGAVEHLPVAVVPNLARFIADVKGPELWAYAAVADAATDLWRADFEGGVLLVLGAEGKGIRPLVRRQ